MGVHGLALLSSLTPTINLTYFSFFQLPPTPPRLNNWAATVLLTTSKLTSTSALTMQVQKIHQRAPLGIHIVIKIPSKARCHGISFFFTFFYDNQGQHSSDSKINSMASMLSGSAITMHPPLNTQSSI